MHACMAAFAQLVRKAALPLSRRLATRLRYQPTAVGSAGSLPSSIRAVSTHSAADGHLVESLKIEIEDQLRQEASQISLKGSSSPFQLFDQPGRKEVILRRDFGKEKIEVSAWVDLEESSDEDQDEEQSQEPVPCLFLVVNLTKDAEKPALEIRCCYYRESPEITVEHVAYLVDGPIAESTTSPGPYEAPSFESLDDNLQQAFFDLLKPRGINIKLAAYLMDYVLSKERREYMRWLQNVQTFFQS